jgi:hypothetical protein
MGRYAFFNTEFEYKFGFGVQNSNDILEFGGEVIEYMNDGYGSIQWTKDDKEFILNELKDYDVDESFFDKYEKNLSGTYELYSTRIDDYKKMLGCVIYHQLLYTDFLKCDFEW